MMTGSPVWHRVLHKAVRGARMRSSRGQGGQTMPLVLGIILVLSLGTVVLVQNTFQQFPIVAKDLIQHEAYRAMESGLNEYQSAVNTNADFAACSARFVKVVSGTLQSDGVSALTASSPVCSALSFGTWISVPGSGSVNGPPNWFLIDNPVINVTTGTLTVNVVGAAGYKNSYNYQSAVVTLQPLNGFLLNVLWINYDQIDPAVVSQYGGGTCAPAYYYTPNPNALGPNCESVDFVTADSLTGNLFVNDTIFVCGSPSFQNVETSDPTEDWYEDGSGCSGTPVGDTLLRSPLTSGSTYTSLNVQALGQAAAAGDTYTLGEGSTTQTVTLSAAAALGATTVSVNSFVANANYPSGDTSLTAALASGTAYTSLSVQALGQAAAAGDTFTIGTGATTQTVTLSAAAAQGATTVSVNSFTANAAYATGTQVNDNAVWTDVNDNATGTWTSGVAPEQVPTDNSVLQSDADSNGCVYQGPTTITVNGAAGTMTVNSPGTPAGQPAGAPGSSLSNDPLNAAANTANVCVPASWPGTVAIPADGVVYVEGCQSAYVSTSGGTTLCNGQSYNPLSGAGETGVGGDTAGDAIVQGSVNTPMTIGSSNNVIIDGTICYTDAVSGGACSGVAGEPAAPSTDILGLVADNYVEINHPVDSHGNNLSTCSSALGAGTPTCDLSSPTVDAVILALNHSFIVNNFASGSPLGTLTLNGTIDENWRGPVGTFYGSGTPASGYIKNYVYDNRLKYLSPPYYLNPDTSQWGFLSFTVAAGACKLATGSPNTSACTGYP